MTTEEKQPLLQDDDTNSVTAVTNPKRSCLEQFSDPRCLPHRLIVLALMCFLSFGKLCLFSCLAYKFATKHFLSGTYFMAA